MRTYEEYEQILSLWATGYYNKSEISRITGVPRLTVRDCIARYGSVAALEAAAGRNIELHGESSLLIMLKDSQDTHQLHKAYAYLLGLYLGDGCLSKTPRVYRMRIALDAKYPGIIQACVDALKVLLPENEVGLVEHYHGEGEKHHLSYLEVSCYYKYFPQIFPQHGKGLKHNRKIELVEWQQRIVEAYPLEFFRGLYHSDGSRSQNIVKGKNYPRYFFTNMSEDIRQLFCETAQALGLQWKQTNALSVAISQRKDVEWLDEHIGAKA